MALTESSNQSALVISYFGNSVAVESGGQVFQCYLRRNQELPVVGDFVNWQQESETTGVIINILERKSLLTKADKSGKIRPLAANIDCLLIVMAPPPIFAEYLIDRYLIAAELLGIAPVLILNKMDLLVGKVKTTALKRLKLYQSITYPTLTTSVLTKQGFMKLKKLLQGKSAVLVGPSGVGKSSIIAELTGDSNIRINNVSDKGSGKHTTTFTKLYHLPKGGSLIDSPGVREFALWTISKHELQQSLLEFKPFYSQCRFRDCQHVSEPGCAVIQALSEKKISQTRYETYQLLLKQVKK